MRSPLTATFFAVELTGNTHVLLPLVAACVTAHLMTVLLMRRSILTEKVARRGHHLAREYRVDPLTLTRVQEVMVTEVRQNSVRLGVTAPRDVEVDRASVRERKLAERRGEVDRG